MSYCEYIKTTTGWAIDLNKTYHDEKYGFPIEDDNELFGRLLLEINQAGLSWSTILKKETAFRTAYDNFNIETIANYTETDEARLLADPGIIRNRLKVKAAIHNAQAIMELKNEYVPNLYMAYNPLPVWYRIDADRICSILDDLDAVL